MNKKPNQNIRPPKYDVIRDGWDFDWGFIFILIVVSVGGFGFLLFLWLMGWKR